MSIRRCCRILLFISEKNTTQLLSMYVELTYNIESMVDHDRLLCHRFRTIYRESSNKYCSYTRVPIGTDVYYWTLDWPVESSVWLRLQYGESTTVVRCVEYKQTPLLACTTPPFVLTLVARVNCEQVVSTRPIKIKYQCPNTSIDLYTDIYVFVRDILMFCTAGQTIELLFE